jgi:LmbE family N-acetylglucosaminyl deacetylase
MDHVRRLRPNVLITYPVHGISGFHDHLVTHAVVKRAYLQLLEEEGLPLERLAFYTIRDRGGDPFDGKGFPVHQSKEEEIDCILPLNEADLQAFRDALDCYESYQKTIERSGVKESMGNEALFEIYGEKTEKPYRDLADGLIG